MPICLKAETIARIVGYLTVLLAGIVADPDRRIGELLLLTEAERHQLLVEWNDSAAADSQDQCAHELFEDQAEKAPDDVALVFEAAG